MSAIKTCSRCKAEKPLADFTIDRSRKDGRNVYCCTCTQEIYRVNNKNNQNYAWKLKREFGISLEVYNQMLIAQGGGCAACGAKPWSGRAHGRRLHVDHDHSCCSGRKSCGECVRGLLCASCNHALGHASDDPDLLLSLADYALKRRDVIGVLR